MADEVPVAESRYIVMFTWRGVIQTLIVGAVVGFLTWVLTMLLKNYVFGPLLCNNATAIRCSSAPIYAAGFAQVVAALAALFGLARVMAYRPLLGVLAATVALWNVVIPMTMSWKWYAALIACVTLYALAYGLFMLLARLKSMVLAVVVIIILIVTIRLVLHG